MEDYYPIIFGLAGMAVFVIILGLGVSLIKAKAKIKEQNSYKDLVQQMLESNKKFLETQEKIAEELSQMAQNVAVIDKEIKAVE